MEDLVLIYCVVLPTCVAIDQTGFECDIVQIITANNREYFGALATTMTTMVILSEFIMATQLASSALVYIYKRQLTICMIRLCGVSCV